MLKTRYDFIRRLHPSTMILFQHAKGITTLGDDDRIRKVLCVLERDLVLTLQQYEINYMMVDNMHVLEHKKFVLNQYESFYKKAVIMACLFQKDKIEERCFLDEATR